MVKSSYEKVGTGISVPQEVLNIISSFAEEQLISYRSAALSALVLEWREMKVILDEFAGNRPVRNRPALLAQLLAEWKATHTSQSILQPGEETN